jgi:hypothetical protein
MENLIIKPVIILVSAIIFKEFIFGWFMNLFDDLIRAFKAPLKRNHTVCFVLTVIYYLVMLCGALGLFGDYSVLVSIIATGVLVFIAIMALLLLIVWALLPKEK